MTRRDNTGVFQKHFIHLTIMPQVCNPYCATSQLTYPNQDCAPLNAAGGAYLVIFRDCSVVGYADLDDDPTNATVWQDAIDDGVVTIARVVGSLGAPSSTKQLQVSNASEVTTQKEWSLAVKDYNAGTSGVHEYWDDQGTNSQGRKFGFVTSDGKFHGWADSPVCDVSLQIPESNKEAQFYGGNITWLSLTHLPKYTFPTNLAF